MFVVGIWNVILVNLLFNVGNILFIVFVVFVDEGMMFCEVLWLLC